jgi:hypothetical protein
MTTGGIDRVIEDLLEDGQHFIRVAVLPEDLDGGDFHGLVGSAPGEVLERRNGLGPIVDVAQGEERLAQATRTFSSALSFPRSAGMASLPKPSRLPARDQNFCPSRCTSCEQTFSTALRSLPSDRCLIGNDRTEQPEHQHRRRDGKPARLPQVRVRAILSVTPCLDDSLPQRPFAST